MRCCVPSPVRYAPEQNPCMRVNGRCQFKTGVLIMFAIAHDTVTPQHGGNRSPWSCWSCLMVSAGSGVLG